MPMNEITIDDRQWRLHSLPGAGKLASPEAPLTASLGGESSAPPAATANAEGPDWLARIRTRLKAWTPPRGFETTLRDLAVDWEQARRPEDVETSFLSRLGGFAPRARFELVRGQAATNCEHGTEPWSRRSGESVLEIPLSCGGIARDRLRMYYWGWIPRSKLGRIRLLCDLAARARESVRRRDEGVWEESNARWPDHSSLKDECALAAETPSHSTLVRDATFLSAILPFAIAQSKRNKEPLSLLCIAVDRLAGVVDLLGRRVADKAVTAVGETTASMIRSSDIVCRLDDDRILVVLPRAAGLDAVHVAQNIRHAIAANPIVVADQPGICLTVSIGVAAYPSSATNVFSLFDAVDDALVRAQAQGRDQVFLDS